MSFLIRFNESIGSIELMLMTLNYQQKTVGEIFLKENISNHCQKKYSEVIDNNTILK